MTRGLFRGVTDPQPVAHVKSQRDGKRPFATGGLKALHRCKLAAVGLIVFHNQRYTAGIEQST